MAVDKQGTQRGGALGLLTPDGLDHPERDGLRAAASEPYPYDPTHAKRLLAEAGYPNGFDAGEV